MNQFKPLNRKIAVTTRKNKITPLISNSFYIILLIQLMQSYSPDKSNQIGDLITEHSKKSQWVFPGFNHQPDHIPYPKIKRCDGTPNHSRAAGYSY